MPNHRNLVPGTARVPNLRVLPLQQAVSLHNLLPRYLKRLCTTRTIALLEKHRGGCDEALVAVIGKATLRMV
jgi:hypothetical protein